MVKKRNLIVFEIEDYYGNTVMAFAVDKKGNVVKTENCNLADVGGDYIFDTDAPLYRIQANSKALF